MRRKAASKIQNEVTKEAGIISDEKNAVLPNNENQITSEQSTVTAFPKRGRRKGSVENEIDALKHKKNVAEYADEEKAYESNDNDERVAYNLKFGKDDKNIEQNKCQKVDFDAAETITLMKHIRKQVAIKNIVSDEIEPVARCARKSAILKTAANTSKDIESPNDMKNVTDLNDLQLSSHTAIEKKGGGIQMQENSLKDIKLEEVKSKLTENKNNKDKKPVHICLDDISSYKDNVKTKNLTKREKKHKTKKEDVSGHVVKQNILYHDNFGSSVVMKEVKIILNRKDVYNDKLYENSEVSKDSERKEQVGCSQSSRAIKRSNEGSSFELEGKPTKISKKSKASKEKNSDVTILDFSNESKTSSGKPWNFKISSWNINGVRAWLEKDGLSYLYNEKPDILCVQETKCSDDKLPDQVKSIGGYHTYWLSGDRDGYSGVGLITKEKPIKVEFGIGMPEHDNEGRIITAEYESFYLVAGYVPNAGRKLVRLSYRIQWDIDFRAYLRKLDEQKAVILCGDLNVAHLEIDLANPKTNKKNAGFTKEERDGFSALLKENNFLDTFRHLYPNTKGAYTFWTYMMNSRSKNVGWRLDYFVISKRFEDNLCDSIIRKDVFGSDHCPITLFLSLY